MGEKTKLFSTSVGTCYVLFLGGKLIAISTKQPIHKIDKLFAVIKVETWCDNIYALRRGWQALSNSFPDCDWESIPSYLTLGSQPSPTMASEDLREQFVSLIEEQNFPFNNDEALFDFFTIKDFLEVFVQTIDSVVLQDFVRKIETDRSNKKS